MVGKNTAMHDNPSLNGQGFLYVKSSVKNIITFNPQIISPGDTTDIILRKKLADGTLVDFPSNQLLEMGILAVREIKHDIGLK